MSVWRNGRPGSIRAFTGFGLVLFLMICGVNGCKSGAGKREFQSHWPVDGNRIWIGPEYWANRLQDWRIRDGEVECVVSSPGRSLFLLTADLAPQPGELSMSVRLRLLNPDPPPEGSSWIGFRIGIKGEFNDYRDSAVHGKGLDLGLTSGGRLFIGSPDEAAGDPFKVAGREYGLEASLAPGEKGRTSVLSLRLLDLETDEIMISSEKADLPAESLTGGIALVSSFEDVESGDEIPSAAFGDWRISGDKLDLHPDRAFGPILFCQHTLSRGVLKLTAQLPPVGPQDAKKVSLQVRNNGKWAEIAKAAVDEMSRTATFRVPDWDDTADTPYRVEYGLYTKKGKFKTYQFEGLIRKDPKDKPEIVVAGFTGNNDLGFPNKDMVENVLKHRPDFLFFSGDQIYEGVGGFGHQTQPVDKATLDYLRKWYLYGWAYRDLLRDRRRGRPESRP